MSREPSAPESPLWRQFIESEHSMTAARMALFDRKDCLVALIRRALDEPGERAAALDLASRLQPEQLEVLVPDLLALASYSHGLTSRSRDVLRRLPRTWLLANLEARAEPILTAGDQETYRAFIELYAEIEPELADRLARRAARDSDTEIREAGEDYLAAVANHHEMEVARAAH